MQAVILAGGLGTRLRPLIQDQSKPMAQLAGRPFLEYLLLQLKRAGLRQVLLCVGHQAERVREYFGDGRRIGLEVTYSVEQEPRGTAGALKLAEAWIRGRRFLAMNGDSFFDVDFATLLRYHGSRSALGTLALARLMDTGRFGRVHLDKDGRITHFAEKQAGAGSGLVNGGIYVLEREILGRISSERPVSLELEVFPSLIGERFLGLPSDGYFIDIGLPADFLRLLADPRQLLDAVA